MKYLLLALTLLFLPVSAQADHMDKGQYVAVVDGYPIVMMYSLDQVNEVCRAVSPYGALPPELVVSGCAVWNFETGPKQKHNPKGACLAFAWAWSPSTAAHEAKHCREGFWHGAPWDSKQSHEHKGKGKI